MEHLKMQTADLQKTESTFINDVKQIIKSGRQTAYSSISSVMLETYWNVGKRIVEQEQQGKERAEYGKHLIDLLSQELTKEFGTGFSARYLRQFRKFYLVFPDSEIWKTRFPNLTWSHYLACMRVNNETACRWYIETASKEMWSVRSRNLKESVCGGISGI